MKNPFWQDKKDHCVLRYKKALCRQINKQLQTQENVCKQFPCKTDACTLRVRVLCCGLLHLDCSRSCSCMVIAQGHLSKTPQL